MRLSAPNVITIEDLVSPCPAHAQCMWSGIVVRTGNYTVERGRSVGGPMRVVIDVTPEADSMSKPPPSHLSWWNSRGELTESDEKCRYTREP